MYNASQIKSLLFNLKNGPKVGDTKELIKIIEYLTDAVEKLEKEVRTLKTFSIQK